MKEHSTSATFSTKNSTLSDENPKAKNEVGIGWAETGFFNEEEASMSQ